MAPPPPIAIPESLARLRDALGPGAPAARLWPSLSRLDWVAALPNAAAPGFVYLAGSLDGIAVGGGGADVLEAGARLAGEAAEVIAARAGAAASRLPGDPEIDALWRPSREGGRVAAVDLAAGRALGVFLRPPDAAAPVFGPGLAAGIDREAARLAGLLELIERDAVASWWLDGRRPAGLAPSVLADAEARLARLRAGAPALRETEFLALVSPVGVPVVCALSRDAAGGGLAFGFKAALDAPTAAAGATIELLQMEIALDLARYRAAREASTADDLGVLRRAALDPGSFACLSPSAAEPPGLRLSGLDDLVAHLASAGRRAFAVDLAGPPGGLAVAKVLATGLRPFPGGGAARHGAPGTVAPLM
ncbi:MAG TPA: YcaO-like family protein [Amaricoccus sp.]|uniref:YcaO-like family protein n=1 Tax=Amaricoccus sp. TaxID=1872485 RepID=UPI002C8ADDBD|nr:YcaO-like family protein [Amaricoccus sp.]HMQ93399.1 YcaO-like family protein [Amaricoccus sp.]HMR50907.1 YcaO-like family protein [Amaricoccus sp.]HMR58922.1 YcaO-like family protein [Amaricoccus sp.]HMT97914.1 YcaO-like family protein [Amaricoccus sp.]